MRMISPSVALIKESDPFKKIERVGRTCYKSEDKIAEGSARKFYLGLVNREHTAMVEHATFIFKLSRPIYTSLKISAGANKYLNFTDDNGRFLVSGNLRAINESRMLVLCSALYDIDPDLIYNKEMKKLVVDHDIHGLANVVDFAELENPTENEFMHHFYLTYHFITDRGVTHEIVRHRPASFAQESTRYCNYTKDQFGGELTFIKPTDWDNFPDVDKLRFTRAFEVCEDEYARLISKGYSPQQARAVLPNALKTELIMTANAGEFEHFFNLRSHGVTGAPHPDIKTVADIALALFEIEKVMTFGA